MNPARERVSAAMSNAVVNRRLSTASRRLNFSAGLLLTLPLVAHAVEHYEKATVDADGQLHIAVSGHPERRPKKFRVSGKIRRAVAVR